jgi:hypothetical protein
MLRIVLKFQFVIDSVKQNSVLLPSLSKRGKTAALTGSSKVMSNNDVCNTIINLTVDAVAEGLSETVIDALVDAAYMDLSPSFDICVFAIAFDASLSEIIDLIVSSVCDHFGFCSSSSPM